MPGRRLSSDASGQRRTVVTAGEQATRPAPRVEGPGASPPKRAAGAPLVTPGPSRALHRRPRSGAARRFARPNRTTAARRRPGGARREHLDAGASAALRRGRLPGWGSGRLQTEGGGTGEGRRTWWYGSRGRAPCVPTWEGWLDVAVLLDVHARRVGGWGDGRSPASRAGDGGARAGAGPPPPQPGPHPSHRPWLPVHGRHRPGDPGEPWDRRLDESHRRLLRQRPRRELLRHAQGQTRRHPALADTRGGTGAILAWIEAFYNRLRQVGFAVTLTPSEAAQLRWSVNDEVRRWGTPTPPDGP